MAAGSLSSAPDGREKGNFIAGFENIRAVLVFDTDGDEHGILHAGEFGEPRNQLVEQIVDVAAIRNGFNGLGAASEVFKIRMEMDGNPHESNT